MLVWPEFKLPPINLWVMPRLTSYKKTMQEQDKRMQEQDKQWLRNKMPWVTEDQCESFAERVAIMASDKYIIDENNLKQSAIKSMQEAGLL